MTETPNTIHNVSNSSLYNIARNTGECVIQGERYFYNYADDTLTKQQSSVNAELHENGGITPGGITYIDITRNNEIVAKQSLAPSNLLAGCSFKENKTLRDEFAMAALPAIVSAWLPFDEEDADDAAFEAYRLADAMLKERLK